MLAYRHAFHAGNHGDVLKHLVLAEVLRYMGEKDKPYTFIDTHAGAGGYSLEGRHAKTRAEFEDGIARLWRDRQALPDALLRYLKLVEQFNGGPGAELHQYPGSPALAQMLLRANDPMRLYERHPTDERILSSFIGSRAQTKVEMSDGFDALVRELPPPSRRSVLLIDPSYELKGDYGRVVVAVREAVARFAQAVVIVWHPLLQLLDAVQLPRRLSSSAAAAPKGWLHASLQVQGTDERGFGMMGSGVFIINPPHVIKPMLDEALPVLAQRLSRVDEPRYRIEQSARA